MIGLEFVDVVPRMTRDFLLLFDSQEQALEAEQQLSTILVNYEVRLFEEIDNRGKDIFYGLDLSVRNYSQSHDYL